MFKRCARAELSRLVRRFRITVRGDEFFLWIITPLKEDKMHIESDRHAMLRVVCCFVAVALITTSGSVFANDYSVDRVKATLSEIGTGKDARVTVKLKSGNVLKGYIAELGKEDFSIVSKAETQKVLYSDAAKVKKQKLNVGIKIAIAAGVVIGALVGLMYAQCGSGGCH